MFNGYPVIGILAAYNNKIKKLKIDYSVVKWLKNQGCYIIYVSPRLDKNTIIDIFNNIDGLLIPGGEDDPENTNRTYQCAKILINLAYEHGNFPIIGICMGLQYLLTYYSNDTWDNIKTYIKQNNQPNYLISNSDLSNSILHEISTDKLLNKNFFFNHNYNINIETYESNQNLSDKFKVLTTTIYNNNTFLSTIQGKTRPFFGLAWHPEKPNFEWVNHQKIIRTPESIVIGNSISNFFIEYCKLTNHITDQSILTQFDIEEKSQYVFETANPDDSEYDEPILVYIIE
jgi:gamma-glutamyl hydrolase